MVGRLGSVLWRLGAGIWMGTMVFFSFIVAPTVFSSLSAQNAGAVITRIFPLYYAIGIWFGGAAVLGGLLAVVTMRRGWTWLWTALMVVAYGILWYAWHLLRLMTRLDPSGQRFSGLHQLSVTLNGVVMLILLVAMVMEGWSRAA